MRANGLGNPNEPPNEEVQESVGRPSSSAGWCLTIVYALSMSILLFYCYSRASSRYESAVVAMQLLSFSTIVSLVACGTAIFLHATSLIPWWSFVAVAILSAIATAVTLVGALPYNA